MLGQGRSGVRTRPRMTTGAYNRKIRSAGAGMWFISARRRPMNVILAAILFVLRVPMGMKRRRHGWGNFLLPPIPLPTGRAGGKGRRSHPPRSNGHSEQDFTKITLDTALLRKADKHAVPIVG